MLTIKQLQTFYWVALLGTLNKAADKLHITQSAATKRLQEVEAISAVPLFEGVAKKALLTPNGKELLAECERLLDLLSDLDKLKTSDQQPVRTLHLGLTDLTATTWFSVFLRRMKQVYPTITIQPEIDLSVLLQRKVEQGRLDFAILPHPPASESLARVQIGEAPATKLRRRHALSAGLWEDIGIQPERIYGGNNVVALAGLIAAGIFVSCLPLAPFKRDVEAGRLVVVDTDPPAPSVAYHCTFLKHPNSSLGYAVADLARACCDFSV